MISSEAGSAKGDNITQREERKSVKVLGLLFPMKKKNYEQELDLLGNEIHSPKS